MVIKVRSYAFMRKYTAHLENDGELHVPEQATIGEVLQHLGVPQSAKKIILVNGRPALPARILQAHDLLVFYPVLEGG